MGPGGSVYVFIYRLGEASTFKQAEGKEAAETLRSEHLAVIDDGP